jgi:hypothetical protein
VSINEYQAGSMSDNIPADEICDEKQLADYRDLVKYGSAIGIGGSVLAKLLNTVDNYRGDRDRGIARIAELERENAELKVEVAFCREVAGKREYAERQQFEPKQQQGRNEVAWLIEAQFDGKAHWWYGSDFIADANQAVRFSREQDADQVILERGLVGAEAIEHMWCSHETGALQTEMTDEQKHLCRFYGVATLAELTTAQNKHVERLQAKIPPARDEFPRTPREG